MHAVGIDIGGTKIAGALVADDGVVVRSARTPTPATDPDLLLERVVSMVQELSEGLPLAAVGVAAAGFIDAQQSTVRYAPNIAWREEPLRDRLRERLGESVTITIDNDANAAGWAEHRFGAGHGVSDMVMLTVGTGVGGAIVSDGRLLRGGFGVGGELGHITLVPGGLLCGCGAHGCLEQYASGTALLRRLNEVADAGDAGEGIARLRAERGSLGGDEVTELVRSGDEGACSVLAEVGAALGRACASIAAVLDPQLFVVGGGVSVAGDLLLDPVRRAFVEHLPAKGNRPVAEFVIASLGNDAGAIGAADLAWMGAGAR